MSIIQALAMTVAEIPVFVYTTFGQVQKCERLFCRVPWVSSLGAVCRERRICVSHEGQRHDGVMLRDLGGLRVCKNWMECLGWWERRASYIPPERTPEFRLSLLQRQ